MLESNEVPTYRPPDGVRGPTLGRDLPDGCERLGASIDPNFCDEWWDGPGVTNDRLYWWRFPPLKVGDRVQLTGTVNIAGDVDSFVLIDGAKVHGPHGGYIFPTKALTRVVDQ